jgi:hypothetical protein
MTAVEAAHVELEARYGEVERERDELYAKFEATVRAAQARSEAKNEILAKRLAEAEHEFTTKRVQIQEVLVAAQLDPHVLSTVAAKLDAVLESRNVMIRDLQSSVGRVSKAHNDAVRVYQARLRDLGVPEEELAAPLLPTAAGLVARPSIP